MKFNCLATVLAIFISFGAEAAQQKTVPTLVTCEQNDGDHWIEVGIALNDGAGLKMLVVAHNEDNRSAKLIATERVMERRLDSLTWVYANQEDNAHLVVSKNPRTGAFTGDYAVIKEGPNSGREPGMVCFWRSSISFQTGR